VDIRVLIVEDHRMFAEAVRPRLEQLGIEVDMATTAAQGMDSARKERPDLVLVDIGLPDESGLELGRRIREEVPEAKVAALTALNSAKTVKEAIRLGFHGYFTKDTNIQELGSSIRAIMEGEVVVPRQAGRRRDTGLSPQEQDVKLRADRLTPREKEILELLVEGSSSDQIAARLFLSRNTVRTHVHSLLSKLQVHSRVEAAALAVRYGLVRKQRRKA